MVKVIAHRGFSKRAPENTISAVRMAIQYRVDYVEIDVHLSKDGIPIVIHDALLGRTAKITEPPHRINELTLEKIKLLDAGSWFDLSYLGEAIPTLEEILGLDFDSSGLMIEIKKGHSKVKPLVTAIGNTIQKSLTLTPSKKIIVGSFSLQILRELKLQFPSLPLIAIAEDFNALPDFISMKFSRLALWHKLITPALMETLSKNKSKIWAFTIDNADEAKSLQKIGVDGIITNDPQSIFKILYPDR